MDQAVLRNRNKNMDAAWAYHEMQLILSIQIIVPKLFDDLVQRINEDIQNIYYGFDFPVRLSKHKCKNRETTRI